MRVALHTKVHPDRIAAYEAAHREVPVELTDAIRAAGATSWTNVVHDYSEADSGVGLPVVWELP
ncbi:L-rhamnose mutarotase [Streptomyces sp. NPDC051987]|uniref:L-rhamnose mutarotase n=1 Tax=Streptomyces sp. NPDC051987 TaxID=3155808 RepID=UPI003415A3BA